MNFGISVAILVAFVACGCGRNSDQLPRGGPTEVRIVNVDTISLQSVAIHVSGASYDLGTIAAGDSVTVDTSPRGESSVEISHAGLVDTTDLDVYLETGYGGRVRAEVTVDSVSRVQHDHGWSKY